MANFNKALQVEISLIFVTYYNYEKLKEASQNDALFLINRVSRHLPEFDYPKYKNLEGPFPQKLPSRIRIPEPFSLQTLVTRTPNPRIC